MKLYLILLTIFFISCNNETAKTKTLEKEDRGPATLKAKHFKGVFSNSYKGDSISFDISPDGKNLENLIFNGYWKCGATLEKTLVGPEGSFDIVDNKVTGHITEPPNGGSTAWRFDFSAAINDDKAEGTFRMNINNLGCDTYLLKWTATAQ